jgi:putative effector of murein hydrolase LrgA (UPF0299 family)
MELSSDNFCATGAELDGEPSPSAHGVPAGEGSSHDSILPDSDIVPTPSTPPPQPPAPASRPGPPRAKSLSSQSAPQQLFSLRRVLDKHVPAVSIPTPGGIDLVKQLDFLLASVPSFAAILAFNFLNKTFMQKVLGISKFPPPLVGMFVVFGTMLSLDDENAAKFVAFFEPAVTLLTHFLPAFFMPGLLNAPAAMSDIASADFLKFVLIITLGVTAIAIKASFLAEFIIRAFKIPVPPRAPPSHATFTPWFSSQLESLFGALTAVTGVLALKLPWYVPPSASCRV